MKLRSVMYWAMGMVVVAAALVIAACNGAGEYPYAAKGNFLNSSEVGRFDKGVGGVNQEIWVIPTEGSRNIAGGGGAAGGGRGGRGGGGGAGGFTQSGSGALGSNYIQVPSTINGVPGTISAGPTPDMLPIPGSPILAARQADGTLVPVPLKHTDVSASITGYIASVGVTQQFQNPYSEKIEAVYVFPLPENAGVNEFVMTIGDRHIRGIIRERAEAEKIYEQARAQGYTASLLNQERPNIFTQKIANIEPGKSIDIQIRYFHTLAYQDGWFEWVFPMVVGPRYNPAGSTDGIGAVARGQRGGSGQKTEIQYLRPAERSGHDISVKVALDAGVEIEELQSVNHKIRREAAGPQSAGKTLAARTVVELDPADSIPNKDFVLRYKVAGNKTKTGLFVQKNKEGTGGWFTLMVVPPEDLKNLPRRAVEMVFVVDTSGSMGGQPIAQAKSAVNIALSKMNPADTFQIVRFDSSASQMAAVPLIADAKNIQQGKIFVGNLASGGGTEMLQGINKSLDFPHDENRTRVVAFLTDGYIGNEIDILKALHDKLADSRVFSFGVGSSVNRYLMDAMARLGHGSAAYLSLNESAEPVMDQYFERISHPAMANIRIDFAPGMKVSDVYPQRIPELFVGRPVIITGRYTGSAEGSVTVTGRAGDQQLRFVMPAAARGAVEENPAISTVWARMKVADLHDEEIYEGRNVTADVRDTALAYGIMSQFTSFVAVNSTHITEGSHGTTVAVPVPVPDGVRYETTVQEGTGRERE